MAFSLSELYTLAVGLLALVVAAALSTEFRCSRVINVPTP